MQNFSAKIFLKIMTLARVNVCLWNYFQHLKICEIFILPLGFFPLKKLYY
jgi:hypothetical protein